MNNTNTKVAIVDDHMLVNDALAKIIESYGNYTILFQAANGKELIQHLKNNILPDLILLDLNMPIMGGYETAEWVNLHFPQIYVLVLTMIDSDFSTSMLINVGVRGILAKKLKQGDLRHSMDTLMSTGYCYSNQKLISLLRAEPGKVALSNNITLTEQEIQYLGLLCSELTYKEIANKMNISVRTIETYKDNLITKLGVINRIGLVKFALRNGLVQIDF